MGCGCVGRTHGCLCVDTMQRGHKPCSIRDYNVVSAAGKALTRAFSEVRRNVGFSDTLKVPIDPPDMLALQEQLWQVSKELY